MALKYKRILLKISGEALGDHGRLFDFEQIDRVADVIRQLHETGAEIAIVIGAGNIWRGRQGPAEKMNAVNADHMGMLGTAINSIAMQDAVERQGIASRVMSAVEMRQSPKPSGWKIGAMLPATSANMLFCESETMLSCKLKFCKNQMIMVARKITVKARCKKSFAFSHKSCMTFFNPGRR